MICTVTGERGSTKSLKFAPFMFATRALVGFHCTPPSFRGLPLSRRHKNCMGGIEKTHIIPFYAFAVYLEWPGDHAGMRLGKLDRAEVKTTLAAK